MNIFFRLFNLDESILEKNKDLMKHILSSVSKNWEAVKDLYSQELYKVFNSYFVSYGDIKGLSSEEFFLPKTVPMS